MSATIDGLAARAITAEEYAAFATAVETAFGEDAQPEDVALWRDITELDRTVAVFDTGQIVATGTVDSLELTVPGGDAVAMAGVTAIGVLPTHRRRGLLRGMMRWLLDGAHERGEPVAGLWASEASIYGRFGFGRATCGLHLTVDTRRAAFTDRVALRGRTRLLDGDAAEDLLPRVYERARPGLAGMLSRSPARWRWVRHDPDHLRDGASRRFAVAYGDRGYALYRIRDHETPTGVPDGTVLVEELVTCDDEALAGLWRYLLDLDLVASLQAYNRPADDLLPLLLVDPRQADARLVDRLWVRLLDVPAALTARGYATDGSIVLAVHDAFCPWTTGTYLLEIRGGTARCAPTAQDPEISVGAAELGAVYLGGVPLSQLARAGRATEHRAGALARADALLLTTRAPWCPFVF
ncbi:MAG TPA: GNAT family N-acetyltransferase [Egibacteraceae bacterium]|nr:GNAT family N-acetyltransferase [Egibacteraceae bacterium]